MIIEDIHSIVVFYENIVDTELYSLMYWVLWLGKIVTEQKYIVKILRPPGVVNIIIQIALSLVL